MPMSPDQRGLFFVRPPDLPAPPSLAQLRAQVEAGASPLWSPGSFNPTPAGFGGQGPSGAPAWSPTNAADPMPSGQANGPPWSQSDASASTPDDQIVGGGGAGELYGSGGSDQLTQNGGDNNLPAGWFFGSAPNVVYPRDQSGARPVSPLDLALAAMRQAGGRQPSQANGAPGQATKSCTFDARFTGVGPNQATGVGALKIKPPDHSLAINASIFGLPYDTIPQREAAQKALEANMAGMRFSAPALNGYVKGGADFTLGDVGDQNIRNSATPRFDIYRFPSNRAARVFGNRPARVTVSGVPASWSCPKP